ncbi:hypothetical protein B7P43_G17881 [Cryptotermes secundus]|uniref:Ionotropic glutamate receptor C-terminal domain-containing protein n=1 Tax=Cryptotermes secundus TaxID=105785 RepID=A0A2J7RCX0_9NEOP|nr:hypothetical protein B7P43_G17881 [Cryptotermes secundus]
MSLHEEALHTYGRWSENFTNFGRVSMDVVGYIFEEMHQSESRSVLISNIFTDNDPTEWNSNHKPESYLLLTPSSCNHESDIVQSVKSQLKRLSSYPEWNPRARFVVTVMNICFKYNAEKVSQRILMEIWKRKITFIPKKAYDTFHGYELRVAAKLTAIREEKTKQIYGNNSHHTFKEDYEIRFLKLISRSMNFTLIFLPQIKNFRKVQEVVGNYIGYTGLLMNDEADIAVGGIIRTAILTNLTDVTISYLKLRWQSFVPCPVKFPGWRSIFRTFSLSGWLFRIQENASFKRFVDAVQDVWALILGVSILSLPLTNPLRLFFSAWICYSLAINTVFQAYLTTYLVDPGFEKSITSTEEDFTSGTKYGFSSTYFDRNFNDIADSKDVEILGNRIDCVDMVTCLLLTAKYRNISTICNTGLVDYLYYGSKYSDKFRGSRPGELKEMPVLVTDLLMALQKGSTFLDRVNEIIYRLVESGISIYLMKVSSEERKYFEAKSSVSKIVADEYHALTMNNMQSAFYLLLFGHSLSLISFLMEMLYFKIHLWRP